MVFLLVKSRVICYLEYQNWDREFVKRDEICDLVDIHFVPIDRQHEKIGSVSIPVLQLMTILLTTCTCFLLLGQFNLKTNVTQTIGLEMGRHYWPYPGHLVFCVKG